MKFKSLIVAALCAASVICAADVNYTGLPVIDLKQYIAVNPNKIKTTADIKTWYKEYKSLFQKSKFHPFTEVQLSYLFVVKNDVSEYQSAELELETVAKTIGKTRSYWNYKYFLLNAGKKYFSAQEVFEKRIECMVNGNFSGSLLLKLSNTFMAEDITVDKNVKIKAYQQLFEKYYVELANNTNTKDYNDMKVFLSKLGLKLKSLGVEVK